MSHADIVSIIWGSLGALLIIGCTVASVAHSKWTYEDDERGGPDGV